MKLTKQQISDMLKSHQGDTVDVLMTFDQAIYAEGYKRGQKEMRERAAKLVEEHYDELEPWLEPQEVRKLEIKEPE